MIVVVSVDKAWDSASACGFAEAEDTAGGGIVTYTVVGLAGCAGCVTVTVILASASADAISPSMPCRMMDTASFTFIDSPPACCCW